MSSLDIKSLPVRFIPLSGTKKKINLCHLMLEFHWGAFEEKDRKFLFFYSRSWESSGGEG
jgi:hypothetical protein